MRGRRLLHILVLIMCTYVMVTVYFYKSVFERGQEIRQSDDYSSVFEYEEDKSETKVDRKLKGHSDHAYFAFNDKLHQNSLPEAQSNLITEKLENSVKTTNTNHMQFDREEMSGKTTQSKYKNFEEDDFDRKLRESAIRLAKKIQQNNFNFYHQNKTSSTIKAKTKRGEQTVKTSFVEHRTSDVEKQKLTKKKHFVRQSEFIRNPNITISTENYNFREIFPYNGIYLYSSFFDTREEANFIRFILIGRARNFIRLWCLLQSNDTDEVFKSEVQFYPTCESHVKDNSVYLCSCEIPQKFGRVQHVNLTNNENMKQIVPINVIPDIIEQPYKYKFSTCVPPLFGDINIIRLTEFIELSRLLGTEHIYFYYNRERGDIHQLLQYYSELGIVTYFPWNLSMETHEIWYHGQSAAIWDCLYRNIRVSELVSFNDIDEFIVPKQTETWNSMLTNLHKLARDSLSKEQDVAVFSFQSVFFDSNFVNQEPVKNDEYIQLLTSNVTMRTSTVSKVRTKMIVYPLRVFELGIHHLSRPIKENFKSVSIPDNVALIYHYRTCDWNYGMNCDRIVKDDSMHKYRNELLTRVKSTLHNVKQLETTSRSITNNKMKKGAENKS
ncbi:uncharacterized protein LOC133193754 [Saccostrea echinata]|uniref:uncharacterized protein LOC133193754 n=1 Tax=Saccostrea echinata TaxID=191078 RepID=UPI002A8322C9|nr:uncharacterized protein LOC133193754 [Saccostrea echinata]